ncbi:MAG TPA: glycosyltransferase family 87 protein [Methylomirabilota bacterium]|nr:glycosyltransferase family 87 protein [Methylomirabilota bacterium]
MRAVWLDRGLKIAVLLGLAALCFGFARADPEDLRGYLAAGRAVLSRTDIYEGLPPGVNTWPPFFSLFCIPLALLDRVSDPLLRYVWGGFNLAALLLALNLVSRAVYGKGIAHGGESPGFPIGFLRMFVPLFLTLPYIDSNIEHQQVSILIFVLVLAGLLLDRKGKPALGGIALGAAIAMKIMPAIFLFYWAYRRRRRAAVWGALATLGFSLSPMLAFGPLRFGHDAVLWFAIVRQGWGAGSLNLSLLAMLDRILGHGFVPFVSPGVERLAFSGAPVVRIVWLVSLAAIGTLCLLAFRRRAEPGSRADCAEWSVVLLLSAIAGPVMWRHYLVVALLGNAVLWAVWLSDALSARARRGVMAVLVLCFVMSLPVLPDSLGKPFIHRLEMSSIVTDAALLLIGALLWLRFCVVAPADSPGHSHFIA